MLTPRRQEIQATARRAAQLLLWLGPESYRDDIVEAQGRHLFVSPLAGQEVTVVESRSMLVGPINEVEGVSHWSADLSCGDTVLKVHCEVMCSERPFGGISPRLIKVTIYFGDTWMIRNVSVMRDGSLEPWGVPEEFDPGNARIDYVVTD